MTPQQNSGPTPVPSSRQQPANWLITGASGGLGKALSRAVLLSGARAVCTCRRAADLDDLHAEFPGLVEIVELDLADAPGIPAAISAALSMLGTVDVLVNNAGINTVQPFEEMEEAHFIATVQTNLMGTVAVTRALVGHMRERRRGHIIMMSSTGGFLGTRGFSAYSASKFGIEGFSEALSEELTPFGVHTIVVEPGPFRTGFRTKSMQAAPKIPDYRQSFESTWSALADNDGKQPGDPALAAEAIMALTRLEFPPFRVPLGDQAVALLHEKIRRLENDLKQTQALHFITSS